MGEYEPNDSRNVTGAANQQGQNEGNPNTQQGGQHWQQSSHQTQPGAMNDPAQSQPNPIAQNSQQGHGQDPGMRQGNAGQQQQFEQGGGQMGGGGQTGGQMGGGSGYQGTAAGGQNASMRQDGGTQSRFAGQIREHMEVIGADGVHLGTVDHVDGDRIKLTKADSGMGGHQGHHHYLPIGLVAEIEGDRIRLSANADVAYGMEEEEGGSET